MDRRPSQKQIAEKAGVSTSTVSLALRGDPRISEETKQKVARAAEELGYAADTQFSHIMSILRSRRRTEAIASLAFIHFLDPKVFESIIRSGPSQSVYLGAKERAHQHGYALDTFSICKESGLTAKRAEQIMKSRGIEGAVVASHVGDDISLDFSDPNIKLVVINRDVKAPTCDCVEFDFYDAVRQTTKECYHRGYERPCLALGPEENALRSELLIAPFFDVARQLGKKSKRDRVFEGEIDSPEFESWFERLSPDVIIADKTASDIGRFFKKRHMDNPSPVALVRFAVWQFNSGHSGIRPYAREMGRIAVDQLLSLIYRKNKNLSITPIRTIVGGEWFDCGSLPNKVGQTNC